MTDVDEIWYKLGPTKGTLTHQILSRSDEKRHGLGLFQRAEGIYQKRFKNEHFHGCRPQFLGSGSLYRYIVAQSLSSI